MGERASVAPAAAASAAAAGSSEEEDQMSVSARSFDTAEGEKFKIALNSMFLSSALWAIRFLICTQDNVVSKCQRIVNL